MLASEIIEKFNKAKYDLALGFNSKKIWFEITLCENYDTHSSLNYYKFSKIYEDNGAIILKNRRGKIVKVLTKYNTKWISCILLRSKSISARLVDYHFTDLEVKQDEK